MKKKTIIPLVFVALLASSCSFGGVSKMSKENFKKFYDESFPADFKSGKAIKKLTVVGKAKDNGNDCSMTLDFDFTSQESWKNNFQGDPMTYSFDSEVKQGNKTIEAESCESSFFGLETVVQSDNQSLVTESYEFVYEHSISMINEWGIQISAEVSETRNYNLTEIRQYSGDTYTVLNSSIVFTTDYEFKSYDAHYENEGRTYIEDSDSFEKHVSIEVVVNGEFCYENISYFAEEIVDYKKEDTDENNIVIAGVSTHQYYYETQDKINDIVEEKLVTESNKTLMTEDHREEIIDEEWVVTKDENYSDDNLPFDYVIKKEDSHNKIDLYTDFTSRDEYATIETETKLPLIEAFKSIDSSFTSTKETEIFVKGDKIQYRIKTGDRVEQFSFLAETKQFYAYEVFALDANGDASSITSFNFMY